MKKLILSALIVLGLATSAGCQKGVQPVWSTANPSTDIEIGPARIFNNKNVNIEAKRLHAKSPTGIELDLDGFKMLDNASDVRTANVEQIKAGAELTTAAFRGAAEAISALGTAASSVAGTIRRPDEATIAEANRPKWYESILPLLIGGTGAGTGLGIWLNNRTKAATPTPPAAVQVQ